MGVDGWGVDYALLDAEGDRIGHSFCYRDARNVPAMEKTFSMVPQERMYEITGIQFLPFNTVYQLVAHVAEFPEEWERAARWLTLPEYFQYRLTGVAAAEYTEASTTQLLDVRTRILVPGTGLRARARVWRNSRPSCKPARCWENCARKSAKKWAWRTRR